MIRFETKFNNNVSKQINKLAMKKLLGLYIIFSFIFVLIGIMFVIDPESLVEDVVFGYIAIAFGLGFYPLVLLLTKIAQKRIDKTMYVMSNETIEIFEFSEDLVHIETIKGEDYKGVTDARYNYFYKVIKTKDAYFLYISKMQVHYIPISSLTEGNIEELDHIFLVQLHKKFKKR